MPWQAAPQASAANTLEVVKMNFRTVRICVAVLGALSAAVALAQDKPTDKPQGVVPKHACVRPETPAKFENEGQQKIFVKQMDGYRDCLMAYRNDMNKIAQAHIDAANAAIEEFNHYVSSINKK
jgi:hypothetical protein